jgi:vancomycin resistance protein YoaR
MEVSAVQRREPPRRPRRAGRRRVNNRARIIGLVAIVALLFIAFRLLSAYSVVGFGPAKYYNVTVNGISLEGYTKSEARALFDNLEKGWANATYALTYGDNSWTFSASTFDATIDIDTQLALAWNLGHYGSLSNRRETILSLRDNPRAFISELTYDKQKLDDFIAGIKAVTDVAPVDAQIVLDVTAPRIVADSEDGLALDVDRTREQILNLIMTGQGETALTVNVVSPSVSSDEASGGLEVIASYVTDVSTSTAARKTNVDLALRNFNGLPVYDGDTISFNDVVGARTEENGFKEAPEYDGNTVVMGVGGGSCQASTTLYCAVIQAGVDIIERHPHNMTVAYAEPSMDATVSWPKKDFVFQNNTGHTIYIYTKVTDKKAYVVVYGNRPEYKIQLISVITKKGIAATRKELREDVTGRHAYYTDEETLIEQGKDGCQSQGWLVYYDWNTGEEVSREMISEDTYSPGTSIYWVGVYERSPVITPNPSASY